MEKHKDHDINYDDLGEDEMRLLCFIKETGKQKIINPDRLIANILCSYGLFEDLGCLFYDLTPAGEQVYNRYKESDDYVQSESTILIS